jgi:hypothetical protein
MDDNLISEKTLRMMDKAAINLRDGKAAEPVDLEKIREIADSLENDE